MDSISQKMKSKNYPKISIIGKYDKKYAFYKEERST
jgi:hypothetical protein